jgi:hypothetical protein
VLMSLLRLAWTWENTWMVLLLWSAVNLSGPPRTTGVSAGKLLLELGVQALTMI